MLGSALLLSACEDWLELQPDQGLTIGEYWTSKEDVEATLLAAYRNFALLDDYLFVYGELRGDLIDAGTAILSRDAQIISNNIPTDNPNCDWSGFYKVIHHCNLVLENSDQVQETDPNFKPVILKSFKAEALYLRSLSYFYLIRIFKDVPFISESSETDNTDFFIPASKEEEIIELLIADLELARSYMPVNNNYGSVEANRGRAGYAAINALMADIYLWDFRYEECLEAIDLLEGMGKYQLMSPGDWFDIFYPGSSLESIFEFQFDQSTNLLNTLWVQTYNTNRFNVSDHALELLDPESSREIIRGNGSVCTEFSYHNTRNAAFIWKYCGSNPDGRSVRASSENRSANYIIYRYADILLMKAEAQSQLGGYTEALGIINEIRTRASMPLILSIQNTATAFEDAILDERARELAYEGKRWFDLLRMGRRNDYARADKLIEIMIRNVSSAQRRILASRLKDPMGWYLPIYEMELERNRALEQNIYYQ